MTSGRSWTVALTDRRADHTPTVVPSAEDEALGALGRQRVLDAATHLTI